MSAKAMLDAFADWIGTTAALRRQPSNGDKRQLWTHEVIEDEADAPAYTLLRIYPGPARGVSGLDVVSVQAMTRGVASPAWAQAEAVYETLLDDIRRLLVERSIAGYQVKAVLNLRPPGQIGSDDKGNVEIVTNFDVGFAPST